MRVRVTTTALGLVAVTILALPACSSDIKQAKSDASSSPRGEKFAAASQHNAPLSSSALKERLLHASDLGSGYSAKPERPAQHDDVSVLGCPALDGLGGEAATGGSLNFPRQAKAAFTYSGGSDSETSEELYSDTSVKLSTGTGRIFDAMTGCPEYQVLVGGMAVDIATQKMPAPRLGDERWSQLMTFSAGGRDTVVKQTAVRDGSVLVVVSGAPALVDQHIGKAVARAAEAR